METESSFLPLLGALSTTVCTILNVQNARGHALCSNEGRQLCLPSPFSDSQPTITIMFQTKLLQWRIGLVCAHSIHENRHS